MRALRRIHLLAALWVLALGGCATQPIDSGRSGLFDQLSDLDRANTRARPPRERETVQTVSRKRMSELRRLASEWQWPLEKVAVTSSFGRRGRDLHEGIDLKARSGTPVYAAQSGKVVYAGRKIRGYGKLVVIQHPSGLSTVYAHNSKLLVKKGQRVKQGQKIAASGATGRVTGPHLHFEIRDGESPINPMDLLPSVHAWNNRATSRHLASRER